MARLENSAVPLYRQIAALLQTEIESKRLLPLQQLPSESELTQKYGVSRITVRQAIRLLVESGLVVTRQGKGAYVKGPLYNQDLGPLRGFYDGLLEHKYKPETQVVEFERVAPEGPDIAQARNVYRYVRLYRFEGMIIVLAEITVHCYDKTIRKEQVEQLPVYALIAEVMGRKIARAATQIKATGLKPDVARRMGLDVGEGLLQMSRSSYDEKDQILESSNFYIRPDMFAFEMEIAGPMRLAPSICKVEEREAG